MDTLEAREVIIINIQIKKENQLFIFNIFQSTTNDFAARSLGFIQEAMKWAPSATRSHLQNYITQIPSSSYWHHSGLALATESVLQSSGLNFHAAPLSVFINNDRYKYV